jgi:hypothetical protein
MTVKPPPSAEATFPELKQLAGDQNPKPEITVSSWTLRSLVELLLSFWPFDEQWYLSTYPDIAEAIRQGKFASGRDHYLHFGYFENRLPFKPEVDAGWYAREYPDVAESIEAGISKSALAHFIASGYREGRQPTSDNRATGANNKKNSWLFEFKPKTRNRQDATG